VRGKEGDSGSAVSARRGAKQTKGQFVTAECTESEREGAGAVSSCDNLNPFGTWKSSRWFQGEILKRYQKNDRMKG